MKAAQTILEQYRSTDIASCNADDLTDLRDVQIDDSLPVRNRLEGFLRQVGNPYLFKVDGLIVKATYLPGASRTLSDALPGLLSQ